MRKLRIIACGILAVFGLLASHAEIVITTDTETTVEVAQVKSLTFDGDFNTGNLLVNYNDGTTVKFPISDIKQVTLKTDEVDAIASVSSKPSVAVQGDLLLITAEGGKVGIFDASGRQMTSVELTTGTTPLSLNQLPDGIYIANINGHIVKFQKR